MRLHWGHQHERNYYHYYYPVYNPHPFFTATGNCIGAVRAWPKTNVTSHKLLLLGNLCH